MAALCQLELAAHSRRYPERRPAKMGTRANVGTPAGPPEAAGAVVESNHKEPDNRHSFDSPS